MLLALYSVSGAVRMHERCGCFFVGEDEICGGYLAAFLK